MAEDMELILEETEDGYFVNGFEVSEETYFALVADLGEPDEDEVFDEEECGDCDFCDDVIAIVNFVKENDEEQGFDYMSDVLYEYYMNGRADAFEDMANACDDELDEIYEDIEE